LLPIILDDYIAGKKELIKEFQKNPDRFWRVKLFDDLGFQRRQCKSCGNFFWTLTDREVCSDASCRPYEFIGSPATSRKFDYITAWKALESFFVENGHTSVKRYPVVCRWYPLYFTIAGIVDFYRIENKRVTFEHPANPLIVPQVCLRFNDMPNVGVTGRAETSFCMANQTAFYDGKNGYWKDRCIELDYAMLTKAFGVRPEDITFAEDVWLGDSAFGASLEFRAKGLELGNAVFTEFSGTPSSFTEMKEKVIDMGAGSDRLAWLSQGTPTVYDAAYGPVIERMKREAGIGRDDLFLKYSKLAGGLDLDDVPDVDAAFAGIAGRLGTDPKELKAAIEPHRAVYAVMDHTKTLLFALSDGALFSNVGGGYNLRALFRRAMGFLDRFKFPFDIYSVAELEADFLKPMNPELAENLDYVNKVLRLEEEKYKETKTRTRGIVKSLIESKAEFTEDVLTELYDSQGISPELLQEAAEKEGIKIEIPTNFYADITDRHAKEKTDDEKESGAKAGLPKTEKLYYENEKMYAFEAKVLQINGEDVVLDRTAFYPRGGGQEPDHGTVGGCQVYDVEKSGDVIFHKVRAPSFKAGGTVSCTIEQERRERIRRHHTATHLITMAARETLGKHVWQAGSKKDADGAHLDITHYESLTSEQVRSIEDFANGMIRKRVPVVKELLPRGVAERKYGFVIYQGGSIPEANLRVISIAGIESEACGGLHVDNTSEIEKVYIFSCKKVQDGFIRFEFVAGERLVEETMAELERRRQLDKERLEAKLAELREKKVRDKALKASGETMFGVNYVDTDDMRQLRIIANESVKKEPERFVVLVGNGVVVGARGKKCNVELEAAVKEAAGIMGGFASGKGGEFKGGGPLKEKGKDAAERLKQILHG
jgi:alanyl-tRNA synthetase